MSKTNSLYHIVFCTKARESVIPLPFKEDLYRFIWNEIKKLNCQLIRIGGVENHIHILLDLHPSVALATLVRTVKASSSSWIRRDSRFPHFKGWAAEYFASTIGNSDKDSVKEYIKNQEQHHLGVSDSDEFIQLYSNAGLTYRDQDLR